MGDSWNETMEHISRVDGLLCGAAFELECRGSKHDASKLEEPEKSAFDKVTGTVGDLKFGTPEYHNFIKENLKDALKHHYEHNSHHPQHYSNGINGMNLFDVIEMFFDWKASGERTKDGNIYRSIEINKERFKISDQLAEILVNTAKYLGYE